jgi:hypothetical protein
MSVVFFDDLPRDMVMAFITADPQTWRVMRRVSTYYHQQLSWSAYVNKFTVVTSIILPGGKTARTWTVDGKLHREHDLPALVSTDGFRGWFRRNGWHRDGDRPAIIYHDGGLDWYQHNRHRRNHDRHTTIYSNGVTYGVNMDRK